MGWGKEAMLSSMSHNKKGFSTLGIMISLLALTMMSLTALYQTVSGKFGQAASWTQTQCSYIAQAGIEYAMRQLYLGQNPSLAEPGKSFSGGSFVINYTKPNVAVTGRMGNCQKNIQFTSPTEGECISFDTASANLDGNNKVHHIDMHKKCLSSITLDKISLSWTNNTGEKVNNVRIENNYVYNNVAGAGSGAILELSDYTFNSSSTQEISKIEFDPANNVAGKTMTLVAYFSDGSQSSPVSFLPSSSNQSQADQTEDNQHHGHHHDDN